MKLVACVQAREDLLVAKSQIEALTSRLQQAEQAVAELRSTKATLKDAEVQCTAAIASAQNEAATLQVRHCGRRN